MTKWQAQCARSASLCTGQPTADFPRPGVRVCKTYCVIVHIMNICYKTSVFKFK